MSEILSIKDLNLKAGDKVFIRCDFNVPMDEFLNITDDRRIRSSIPTIKYCLDEGCSVILASHLGRPKNGYEEKFSLRPVAKRLSRFLDREVKFVNDIAGYDAKMAVKIGKFGKFLCQLFVIFGLALFKSQVIKQQNFAFLQTIYRHFGIITCYVIYKFNFAI